MSSAVSGKSGDPSADAPTTQQMIDSTVQPAYEEPVRSQHATQNVPKIQVEDGNVPSTQQMVDNLRGSTPVPDAGSVAGKDEEQTHPSIEKMEAAAEAGVMGGAPNPTTTDQTEQTTDTTLEKAINFDEAQAKKEGVANSSSDGETDGEKPAADPPEKPQRSKGKTALIMFGLCMATFLGALDTTIITTALPTIAAALDASSADYTWIGASYLLASAASTPSWGKISDIWGRKPIIMAANVIFFVGSIICAVAYNINMLLAGRVIQGIGGGGLISLTQICISDLFSMRDRGMYFGIIGMVWALASAIGPVLGGVFTQLVSWRWCFYINLPCDGAAFLALFFFLDIETPKTPFKEGIKAIDWLGSLTIVGGTIMLLLGLEFGGISFPWNSATVICLIIFGVVTMALFFVVEKYIPKYPVMPLRIFTKRNNIASLATCFCHGFVFISSSYFMPLYFQTVLDASPLLSGVYTFPYVIPLSLVSAAVGIYIRKTGQYRRAIWFGLFFQTIGFGLYINLQPYASWARIIVFQIIAGIGVGPNFQGPLIALQSKIHPRDIASATATFGFTRNMSTAISVIVGGVILQNQLAKYISESTLPANVQAEVSGGSTGANTAVINTLPAEQHAIVNEAYTMALRDMWIFYTCIAFVGILVSLLIEQNDLSTKHEVTKTGLAEQEKHRLEQERLRKEKRASKLSMGSQKPAGEANV